MTTKVSCLIPFFNEEVRLEETLRKVCRCKNIAQIIVVDDGSTDNSLAIAKKFKDQITIVSLKDNHGKTTAVKKGLSKIKTKYVFLLDADLSNLKSKEIDNAIAVMQENSSLDMLLLRRVNTILSTKIFSGDLLYTGERILQKKDLHKILKNNVFGYQLEPAINDYFFSQKKSVAWYPFSAVSLFKIYKRGLVAGLVGEAKMVASLMKYKGVSNYLEQYWHCYKIKKIS